MTMHERANKKDHKGYHITVKRLTLRSY